jgi:hypothetical protein
MRNKLLFMIVLASALNVSKSQTFSIARIHYDGGGDWYSDPSSIPNLLGYLTENTPVSAHRTEFQIKLTDDNISQHPYLYMTGHGNIRLSDDEVISLRSALMNGSFLHADDNYGMDESFRRELKKVFPNKDLVPLPNNHAIFKSYYKFENGLPKIHEHDKKPPQALALFEDEKILVLYTYESDLGDGWEDASVHNDPLTLRESALKMGVNIIYFSLIQ